MAPNNIERHLYDQQNMTYFCRELEDSIAALPDVLC